jgi:molecular chaperone HscB
MLASVDEDLRRAWAAWDAAMDANDDAAKNKQKDAMVAMLDRRSYLRNLLREVDGVLTSQGAVGEKANI